MGGVMRLDRLLINSSLLLPMPNHLHSGTTTIHRTTSFNERPAESGRGFGSPLLTSAGINAGQLRTDINQH